MVEIIEFPSDELSPEEREQLKELINEEFKDIQDTSCESHEEIQDDIMFLADYFRRFMSVAEDPKTKLMPDLDFSLLLLEGRVKKIISADSYSPLTFHLELLLVFQSYLQLVLA